MTELIDRLHETILLSSDDSIDDGALHEIEKSARRNAKQARTDESVELARALEKLARAIGAIRKNDGNTDIAQEILPALYALEEFVPAVALSEATEPTDEDPKDNLRLDLRPDYERLRQLEAAEQRLLETGLREGRRPVVVRVDECGGAVRAIREKIEQAAAVVRLVEEPTYDRIVAIVVEPIAPGLQTELETIHESARLTVQEVDPDSLRSGVSIARDWYKRLPPIRFETLQSSMETLQFYLEQVVRRSTDPFVKEFADLLGNAFTVGMRDILDSMRPSLQELSRRENRPVDIELLGDVDRIGAEMGDALREALFELITNAILHGIEGHSERRNAEKSERGRIQIRAYHDGGSLRIDVVDDGRGLDERLLKEAMRDTTRKSGLYRVRRTVARRFGGKVLVRSTHHGTTVSLRLPGLHGVFFATVFGNGSRPYCLPSSMVVKTFQVSASQISRDIAGGTFLRAEGRTVPFMVFGEDGVLSFVRHVDTGWALLLRFCGKWIALSSEIEPETGAAVPVEDGSYTVPNLDLTGVALPLLPDTLCYR